MCKPEYTRICIQDVSEKILAYRIKVDKSLVQYKQRLKYVYTLLREENYPFHSWRE